MEEYQSGSGCRMQFLQRTLDDPTAAVCGRCDTCAGTWFPTDVPQEAVDGARSQLGGTGVVIEPRAQWPSGMDRLGVPVKGRIPADEAMSPGRALARVTDLGWGPRLRELLSEDQPVPDQVVRAVVRVLAEWGWQTRPAGIVVVPSRSRPTLVTSLADQLGQIGRLPVLGALTPVDGGPVGEPGGNSAYRLAGVWERLTVDPELAHQLPGLTGPVLLVDDVVHSRWTMTTAARALRRAGAREVLPFALAVDG